MTVDEPLRIQLDAIFGRLSTAAAANSFPAPMTLSVTLGSLIPTGTSHQRNTDAKTASYFATAAIDIWLRAVHSFLVSAALTDVSPIWASVSGYYASDYSVRGLAHLLGYFQLFQRKRVVQLSLAGGQFVCSFDSKNGNDREHKLYWRLVKQSAAFKSDDLFTQNDPGAPDSDIGHRNRANYADHLGSNPPFRPLDNQALKDRIEYISKISFDAAPIPRLSRFPDVEYVQLIAYHRIVGFRRLLDEILGGKNRFWNVYRNPPFVSGYMDFQLVPGDGLRQPTPN